MYTGDIISKLNQHVIRISNVDYYPKARVQSVLREIEDECIRWSVDDFRQMAIQNSDETTWNEYYEEKNFSSALAEMINRHDAEHGINWDTVDYYLETYCKIKDYVEPFNSKINAKIK